VNDLQVCQDGKINRAYQARAVFISALPSEGERAARTAAWSAFISGELRSVGTHASYGALARRKYLAVLEAEDEAGLFMDISAGRFATFFIDELSVVRRAIGHKGPKLAFYLAALLAISAVYKLLF
jgi:hypothetical protein